MTTEPARPARKNPFANVIEPLLDEHPEWRSAVLDRDHAPVGELDFWGDSTTRAEYGDWCRSQGYQYLADRRRIWAPPGAAA
ncbi:MAG TPA: hypothetical protein VFQ44_02465 [Streptosporangiaceae bacterium]|nr:hypothetical protein [Streptosporangiaceae bacterium]